MSESTEWIDLLAVEKIEPHDVTEVTFNKRTLAVYDTEDGITVSDARCTHAGANLCDGYFDGKSIECPLHQGLFDCKTGAALAKPAIRPIKVFEARIRNGMLQFKQ